MPAANDFQKRVGEVQLLIAGDNMDQAIPRLMDFVKDFSKDDENLDEVIVLSASYSRLEKQERRGTMRFEELEMQRNKLLMQALELMRCIRKEVLIALPG
jgi:hypothetical protein